jgi:hypothetical protein
LGVEAPNITNPYDLVFSDGRRKTVWNRIAESTLTGVPRRRRLTLSLSADAGEDIAQGRAAPGGRDEVVVID